jgi:hypothetical protein
VRRRARRLLLGLAGLVVVVLVAFATVLELPGGPLEQKSGGGVGFTRAKVGDVMTFQFPILRNPTGRLIRLRSIEPRELDPGLQLVGIRLAPRPLDLAVVQPGWPPRGRLFGADGYELPSRGTGEETGAVVIIGLRYTAPGEHSLHDLRVHYRDRGLRRVATVTAEISMSGR